MQFGERVEASSAREARGAGVDGAARASHKQFASHWYSSDEQAVVSDEWFLRLYRSVMRMATGRSASRIGALNADGEKTSLWSSSEPATA